MAARRILVVYGTTDGQTERIASRIAAHLRDRGFLLAMFRGDSLSSAFAPSDFDGIVVGASLRYGKHQSYVEKFVRGHASLLNARPSAFFSVSCAAASPLAEGPAEARQRMEAFLAATGWKPRHAVIVAGALMYRRYNPLLRLVMKRIARKAAMDTDTSRNHEYTDWTEVERFAASFAQTMEAAYAAHRPGVTAGAFAQT